MSLTNGLRRLVALAFLLLVPLPASGEPDDELFGTGRLRIGVGDRLVLWDRKPPRPVHEAAHSYGLPIDYLQVWITPGWRDSWLSRDRMLELGKRGVVPVVTHYWFGDDISQERFQRERDAWYGSLWRMAQRIRMDHPVLVVLEPEFNVHPPRGEKAVVEWPAFPEHLRAAAKMIREQAPNARVGVCAGDFPGPPRLERVLGPVAPDLDFLAFQEMRADTDPVVGRPGYLGVGRAAVEYATYLHRAFDRPVLLAYVAVSSHGGWEERQASALFDLARREDDLRRAGVFGLIYFQLFDDASHEGYFGPAEKHFGLVRGDGRPKPALSVLRGLARRGRAARAANPR